MIPSGKSKKNDKLLGLQNQLPVRTSLQNARTLLNQIIVTRHKVKIVSQAMTNGDEEVVDPVISNLGDVLEDYMRKEDKAFVDADEDIPDVYHVRVSGDEQ